MEHSHSHEVQGEKNLKVAFFLNLGFTIVEIFGGMYVNSVAILSDAVHDLGDSLSLGTAWYLQRKSNKEATEDFNYGYRRFSILGALLNSVILIAGSIYVVSEAIKRLQHPETSDAQGMIWLAILGILVNGWAVYKLNSGTSLNERVVSLHLLEDVLGWVAVLIVAIILLFVDIPILDPLLSLGITAYILTGTFKRLYEVMYILMQGKPKDLDRENLKMKIQEIDGVERVESLRIWTLDGEEHVISLEVKLYQGSENTIIKSEIRKYLENQHFKFITIETL